MLKFNWELIRNTTSVFFGFASTTKFFDWSIRWPDDTDILNLILNKPSVFMIISQTKSNTILESVFL